MSEREKLTALLLDSDHPDADDALKNALGAREVKDIKHKMRINGGGEPTRRDWCACLDVTKLHKVCVRLGLVKRVSRG